MEKKQFRYYQEDADKAIYDELITKNNDRCIVKMFCGTGKSLLMLKMKIIKNKNLIVYVFPSLCLIKQFYDDYLKDDFPNENILKISSEDDSTTNNQEIKKFLSKDKNKIICITYQSFETLLLNLNQIKIDVCVFDEAHHAAGEFYQTLIFENNYCIKQVFLSATPKNANGIIMYDKDNLEDGMCGELVYDYSYLKGLNDDYLNPFDIRIDMYSENTNKSIYESIARSIIITNNNRVLTFHSDVNTDRNKSVLNFAKYKMRIFKDIFNDILEKEFPNKKNIYKKIRFVYLDSKVLPEDRKKILEELDNTPNNEIMIISSCETIGEGVDTKKANMCVFVDPKQSFVKIIQNIGRIVRKQSQKSTILIPCWVDKTKYLECNGDRDKCDEVIREDMNKDGNFNGILNVLSALKQEDEDLYDICLNYPSTFRPQEIQDNLKKQGLTLEEPIKDGQLLYNIQYLFEKINKEFNIEDYQNYTSSSDVIMKIAQDNDVCIEVHNNSLENPIEKYGSSDNNIISLFKNENEIYQPIVQINKNEPRKPTDKPTRKKDIKVDVHLNPDVKVLWNITEGFDINKDICSCVIDCQISFKTNNWIKNLQDVKYYIDTNKKSPSTHDKDKTIKFLGNWLSHQKKNYDDDISKSKMIMKNKEIRTLWTDFLQDAKYKEYFIDNNEIWKQKLQNVKNYIDKYQKLPSVNDKNKDITIKSLGYWLNHQKANYVNNITKCKETMKNEEIHTLWNEFLQDVKYQEYFLNNDEIWKQNLQDVKNYIDKNKKTPSDKDKNKDIKSLGTWLGTQKKNYDNDISKSKEIMKNESIHNLWTKFIQDVKYKEYFLKNDEIWKKNLQNVKKYMEINKKSPSSKDKYKIIQSLGTWLGKQKANYDKDISKSKTIMKNESIHTLWAEFLQDEKYNKYFLNKNKKTMELTNSIRTLKKEESIEEKKIRISSEISLLHKKYKTMNSNNLHKEFNENPQLWTDYHNISEENEKSFPEEEIPRNKIIQELCKLKTKRPYTVLDLGCGKAHINNYFKNDRRFNFTNYDHISFQENVNVCDISKLPDEDDSVEICILSLALWGSNCTDYLKEAHRVLASHGSLYIIEPTKRWSEQDELQNIISGQEASKLKTKLEENNFKIIEESIKKFCYFKCIKQ